LQWVPLPKFLRAHTHCPASQCPLQDAQK